ncbi:hypothetical protein EV175_000629 [Coemansia sp. RSA 1933]|nr:hypothetical protein EV175_000629 [Coemansia sp. RSA 1933]
MAQVSHLSVSGSSDMSSVKSEKMANARSYMQDPRVRKHIYYFVGLTLLSFLPLIFAAIALSFSTPTAGAKAAVYLTTLAVAFTSIGYSAYVTRKKIMILLGKRNDSRHASMAEVNIIGTVADAFAPEQRQYAENSTYGHEQVVSPTLASQTYNPYGEEQQQQMGYPQMPRRVRTPAPTIKLPELPPHARQNQAMEMPNHENYRSSQWNGDAESDYEYNDDTHVHSFQTINVGPNGPGNEAEMHNMYPGANDPRMPYPQQNGMAPQLPMLVPAEQLTMSQQSINIGPPRSGMNTASTSIDNLVVGMLESFHEGDRQSIYSNRNSNRFSRQPQLPSPPPARKSLNYFAVQPRDSGFRVTNVPSQPDSPISGNYTEARDTVEADRQPKAVRRSAIVDFMKKEDAKRKLLASDDDDFFDNDSDDGAGGGGGDQGTDSWKPTSANLDNLAAQLAKVLVHPDAPTVTLHELQEESAQDNSKGKEVDFVYFGSAEASPRRVEQITTPPAHSKAKVIGRLADSSTNSVGEPYSRGSTTTLDGGDTRTQSLSITPAVTPASANTSVAIPLLSLLPQAPSPALPPPTKALPSPPSHAPPPPPSNALPPPPNALPPSPPSQSLPPPPPPLPAQDPVHSQSPSLPPPPPPLPTHPF